MQALPEMPASDAAARRIDHGLFQFSDNPLVTRYAGREMAELWGPRRKFSTWRRLWLALAESEQELGLRAPTMG